MTPHSSRSTRLPTFTRASKKTIKERRIRKPHSYFSRKPCTQNPNVQTFGARKALEKQTLPGQRRRPMISDYDGQSISRNSQGPMEGQRSLARCTKIPAISAVIRAETTHAHPQHPPRTGRENRAREKKQKSKRRSTKSSGNAEHEGNTESGTVPD